MTINNCHKLFMTRNRFKRHLVIYKIFLQKTYQDYLYITKVQF